MTLPPPPQDPFGSQPSGGGGGSQWSGPAPQGAIPPYAGGGQPQGAPQYGQQPGAPWQQQQSWAGAPSPHPNKGGKGKWILVGLALVAVIAVSVVGTVLVLRPDSGGSGQSPNSADGASDFASANDTGPANIITEEPTCEAWVKIARDMEAAVPEWNHQDYAVPAAEWTAQQREVFEKESSVLATSIKKVANLAKQTPHRIVRELYGQYSAYAQAVIDAIPTYASADNYIVAAYNKFAATLSRVCDAIHFRAAQESAPLIPLPGPPTDVEAMNRDISLVPERFLSGQNRVCDDWISTTERYDKDTEAWRAIDANIPATAWTLDQKAVMDAVVPVMVTYADDMERLGRQSANPVWEDFAVFAAQYRRAYVQAIPTYAPNSSYISGVSSFLSNAIYWACKAES
ncbi:hypothetical protein [Mycobacterium sp. URHD0025]|uniref:hypothetical protein n=1 Tax=Mycobacterium sp. URHD0025 TaxID=1298864 RepID=UPI0004909549|nr:hypothetical protein [Mycobacterium sp. URHD0025]